MHRKQRQGQVGKGLHREQESSHFMGLDHTLQEQNNTVTLFVFNQVIVLISPLSAKRKKIIVLDNILLICLLQVLYFLVKGGWILCPKLQQSVSHRCGSKGNQAYVQGTHSSYIYVNSLEDFLHILSVVHILFVQLLTCVRLFVTAWTVAYQAALSMGFPREEYWRGCRTFLQGTFPTQESNPCLLHWQADSLPLSHQGSPKGRWYTYFKCHYI